jgi:hypothetical protein
MIKRKHPINRINFLIGNSPKRKFQQHTAPSFGAFLNIPRPKSTSIFSPVGKRPASIFYGDHDKDGVMNGFDCQPRNKWMQGPEHKKIQTQVANAIINKPKKYKMYVDESGSGIDFDQTVEFNTVKEANEHVIKNIKNDPYYCEGCELTLERIGHEDNHKWQDTDRDWSEKRHNGNKYGFLTQKQQDAVKDKWNKSKTGIINKIISPDLSFEQSKEQQRSWREEYDERIDSKKPGYTKINKISAQDLIDEA